MHVNLILDEEKRSSSPVPLGLVVRLFVIAMLVLGAVWLFSFYSDYHALQGEVRSLDVEWARTESKYKTATRLRNDLGDQETTLGEILGWRDSRIEWGKQLQAVQAVVPAVIQLSDLRVNQSVVAQAGGTLAKVYELRLSGQTPAERSELNVVQLLEGLKGPPFDRFIESAVLPTGSFRQDPTDKSARAFNIVCKYLPRPLP
jgi:hypothetical protein